MASRRLRRKQEKTQRHAPPPPRRSATAEPRTPAPPAQRVEPSVVVLEAPYVERLAYTRTQAAAALGISRSTFIRHVLPFLETIEIGSGSQLIPIDELERFAADGRKPARGAHGGRAQPGRPSVLSDELVAEIRAKHDGGESLAQIACELNDAGTPTAHGGARWWPSTVRAVLDRVSASPRKRT
jgi:hypothetical protein